MIRRFASTLAVAVFVGLAINAHAATYQSIDSADIWYYPFGSGSADLRIWGDGVNALSPTYPSGHTTSHAYMKWDMSSIPAGSYTVQSAKLVVTQQTPGFTLQEGLDSPLEARQLGSNFDESTWDFYAAGNPTPGAVYGTSDLSNYNASGPFQIEINLLSGPADFAAAFNQAVNGNQQLALAATSKIALAGPGGSTYYRLYSNETPTSAPQLVVQYAPVPEPSSLLALAGALTGAVGLLRRRR
ncbi:MAG: PEP-CTERM sorting domain-containing protein [Armatimonadetes bacterium]|nr:PEP-CTERM sorting domain-containing protein [Armatimonadota bacterium]